MKKFAPIIYGFLLISGLFFISCNANKAEKPKKETIDENQKHSKMMAAMNFGPDNRISLNLPQKKAQHQLMNMRSHVVAVQSIINYLSKNEYDKASELASSELGMTEEMKMMCSSFGNEDFKNMGFEFHNNADKMSEVFKTKDMNKSLEALSVTMTSCVNCHAAFKQ